MKKEGCPSRRKRERRMTPEEDVPTFDIEHSLNPGDTLCLNCFDQTYVFTADGNKDEFRNPHPHTGTLIIFDPQSDSRFIHKDVALKGAYIEGFKRANILAEHSTVLFVLKNGVGISTQTVEDIRYIPATSNRTVW